MAAGNSAAIVSICLTNGKMLMLLRIARTFMHARVHVSRPASASCARCARVCFAHQPPDASHTSASVAPTWPPICLSEKPDFFAYQRAEGSASKLKLRKKKEASFACSRLIAGNVAGEYSLRMRCMLEIPAKAGCARLFR